MLSMTRLTTAIAVGAAIVLAAPAVADPGSPATPSSLHDTAGRDGSPAVTPRDDLQPPEHARGREKEERRERHDRDRDDRWDRDRDRDRDRDHYDGPFHEGSGEVPAFCRTGEGHPVFGMSWCHGNREGPAFCRTGEGHPEFGMRWCYEKGYGPGVDRWRRYDPATSCSTACRAAAGSATRWRGGSSTTSSVT